MHTKLSLCLKPGSSKASTPQLLDCSVAKVVAALKHDKIRTASGQLGAVFHSRGSSEESDQSSNFTEYDIWCAVLAPEIFPLIGVDIEPYRRLLQ